MPVDVAGTITGLTYDAAVFVPATTDVITQAALTNTAVALGNRIEFLRNFTPAASGHPEKFFVVRDDFSSGRYDSGDNAIYSEVTWKTIAVGAGTAGVGGGTAKHPGFVNQTLPTSTSHAFFLGAATATPLRFDQILTTTFVVAVSEAGANVATSFGVGFKQDASGQNGGTDCIQLFYQPSVANWQVMVRRASAQTLVNTGVPVVFLNFVVVRIDRNTSTNDLTVFINGVLVATVLAAAAPTGGCTFGVHGLASGADTFVLSTFTDFVELISDTGSTRAGA